MANHKSSLKKTRQIEAKRLHNRYFAKSARTVLKQLRLTTDKTEAVKILPELTKMLDKLAKNNVIHKNKASNLKSEAALHVNSLQ
jgi:small subunit ribosomal protein S20